MNNKKAAIILSVFIIGFLAIVGLMGLSSHIPFIGKALALIFGVILIIFVIAITVFAAKRK